MVYDFWYMVKDNKVKVDLNTLGVRFTLTERRRLKEFIHSMFAKEHRPLESISYIFCSDDYLVQLNKEYLNHNTFTDIITFGLSGKNEPIVSEVYISIDRVRENATTYQTSFKRELHRVIFHGVLHLCGFKDKTKPDKEAMRSKEDYYLKRYFVPRGTGK